MCVCIYYLIITAIMKYVFVGDQNNTVELARLLQLILGCAVNCRNAQSITNNDIYIYIFKIFLVIMNSYEFILGYITNIRSMDENSQTVIMQSIQDLERSQHLQNITTSLEAEVDKHAQIQQLISELQNATITRDQMTQRCLELDSQVTDRT